MKKIINGSRYNTETAQLLGTHETGLPGDINHRGQELYRTKVGKYFIYLYKPLQKQKHHPVNRVVLLSLKGKFYEF